MMRNKLLWIALFCFFAGVGKVGAQGIVFFEGGYDAALREAAKEKKMVFIDFYADWCAPCKLMAKEVFVLPEVGEYFNARFICVKLNAEAPENKQAVKTFKVTAMPTLVFVSAEGRSLAIAAGSRGAEELLKMARVAAGEELAFEDLYAKYKSSKGDLTILQQLLQEAPGYVGSLEGLEADKWKVRVEKLYQEYVTKKMGQEMINAADFRIINTFHRPTEGKEDQVINFIVANLSAFIDQAGKQVAGYVVDYNSSVMERMARIGDLGYKKQMDRINGDLKAAYDLLPAKKMSPYEQAEFYYGAVYLINFKQDSKGYIELMENYFNGLGDQITAMDYASAAQMMYNGMKGQVTGDMHHQAIGWLVKALQFPDIALMNKINMLVMLGDSQKGLKEYAKAKQSYNQAYMESLQMGADMEMTKNMLQMHIQRKLGTLDFTE